MSTTEEAAQLALGYSWGWLSALSVAESGNPVALPPAEILQFAAAYATAVGKRDAGTGRDVPVLPTAFANFQATGSLFTSPEVSDA